MSGTPGTVADNYFRFAVARWKTSTGSGRQQTGSGPLERSLVCRMVETDWVTLGQCSSVQKTRLAQGEGTVADMYFRFAAATVEKVDLVQSRFFDESRRFPPWRQRTGSAVLGVFEGGNRLGGPQAVTTRRENTSGTPGTTSDNHFRFAAAMMKTVESDWADISMILGEWISAV